MIDGKIKGLNEWRKKYQDAESVNYDEIVEGIKAVGKYQVQFTMTKKFPQFLYALAMPFTYIVPKEAVDFYKQDFLNNPVGTGPFYTDTYTQSNKIVYKRHPNYRKVLFPSVGENTDQEILKSAGKQIPFVDKIEVHIVIESQPRWLSFLKGKYDLLNVPKDNFDQAIIPGKGVSDELKKKGISESKNIALDITYIAFNHEHPVFKDNANLRRAMSLAYDKKLMNKQFYNGISVEAQSLIPPNIAGNMVGYKGPYQSRNLEMAKDYLKKAGYENGKGLPEITYYSTASTVSRQMSEAFKKMMSDIGIKIKVVLVTWPEL
jgi:ABC-type transport system substrate-binding protein